MVAYIFKQHNTNIFLCYTKRFKGTVGNYSPTFNFVLELGMNESMITTFAELWYHISFLKNRILLYFVSVISQYDISKTF